MPAQNNPKRVKGKRIERKFIIGSEAWNLDTANRPPGIPEDHTKGWRVYVRNVPEGPDLNVWLKKVQFKLFHTYNNSLRSVENPPFEVTETGWGGFAIDIRLHFQPVVGDKAQWRQHFLQLEPYGSEEQQAQQRADNLVRSEIQEFVEFNEPTETLFDALTDESQWDYLNGPAAAAQWMRGPGPGNIPPAPPEVTGAAGKGKGGKKAQMAGGVAVDKNGRPRTVELPALSTPTNPYSREMEEVEIKTITAAETELAKELGELENKRNDLDAKLEDLKASGDFVVQKKK